MGNTTSHKGFCGKLDAVYNTGSSFTQLWISLASREGAPDWFAGIIALERVATELREYQTVLIPGLLQTEDYARVVMREGRPIAGKDEIDRLAEARVKRHEVVEGPDRPLLWFVVDEVVLRRRFGTPEIMRDQLHHIAKLVDEDRIKFQVIPQDVWYPIPDCPDRFASWRSRIAHH